MIKFQSLLLLMAVTISGALGEAVERTLTSSNGKTVEAILLSVDETSVLFKRASDDKEFTFPLTSLSEDDRAFIANWQKGDEQDKSTMPEKPTVPDEPAKPEEPKVIQPVKVKSDPVVPPHGRVPVQRVLKQIDGKEVEGLLVDFDGTNVVLRDGDFEKLTVPIAELVLEDRIFVRNWRNDMPSKPSLSREFTRAEETWEARVVEATADMVSLRDVDGDAFRESLPLAEFDEDDRAFIDAWRERRWIDLGVTWVLEPRFDEIREMGADDFYQVRIGSLWGLMKKNGEVFLEPQFSEIGNFDENGLAHVSGERGLGLLNREGVVVLKPEFEFIGKFFEDGTTVVGRNGLQGIVDRSGKIVIEPEWESIRSSYCGMRGVRRDGQWGFIDVSGQLVIPCDWDVVDDFESWGYDDWRKDYAQVRRGGRYGLIGKNGDVALRPEWDKIWYTDEREELKARRGEEWFIVDIRGNVLRGFTPDSSLSAPSEYVVRRGQVKQNGTVVLSRSYDRTTKKSGTGLKMGREWIVEPTWTDSYESDGFFFFENKGGPGIVTDGNGKLIYEAEGGFQPGGYGVRGFYDGLAIVVKQRPDNSGNLYGFINHSGDVVVPFNEGRPHHFSGGLAGDSDGNPKKWGFFDTTGKLVVPYEWDRVRYHKEGLAPVMRDGKWGYIDVKGSLVVDCLWDDALEFQEGVARVKLNGQWGFVDRSGNLVVPCEWDEVKDFSGGLAVVEKGKKWGVIDVSGSLVCEPEWLRVGNYSGGYLAVNARPFEKSAASYSLNQKGWKFLDATGGIAIASTENRMISSQPPEFDFAYIDNSSTQIQSGISLLAWGDYQSSKRSRSTRVGLVVTGGKPLLSAPINTDFNMDAFPAISVETSRYGLVDLKGSVLVEPIWDEIEILSSDKVFFRLGGKWGLAERDGTILREPTWDDVGGPYFYYWTSTSAIVRTDGKYGLVYTDSGFVIEPVSEKRLRPWRQVLFREEGKYGLRDLDVGIVVEATLTEVPEPWRGLPFEEAGKVGLISSGGQVALEPLWDEVENLSKHWFRFFNAADGDGKSVLVDRDGRTAVPDTMPEGEYVDFYGDRRLMMKAGDVWTIYEPATGKSVVFPDAKAVYWNGSCSEHDLLWVQSLSDETWRLFDALEARDLGHTLSSKPEWWMIANGVGRVNGADGDYFINPKGQRVEAASLETAQDPMKAAFDPALLEMFDKLAWVAPGVAAAWGEESGLIDTAGKWIFRETEDVAIPRFREFVKKKTDERFQQGLVVIESKRKWGMARLNR